MTIRLDKSKKDSVDLLERLKDIDWGLDYGSVKVQIRDSKVTLVTIERTVKVD